MQHKHFADLCCFSTSVALILELMKGAGSLANRRSMWAQVVLHVLLLLPAISMLSEGDKPTVEVRCIESERQALLKFKQGLEDYYNTLSSWSSNDEDCCKWRGIKCNNHTNHVIELHLGSAYHHERPNPDDESTYLQDFGIKVSYDGYRSNFGGEIGSSLVELIYLKRLDLNCNLFTRIPKFIGSLTRLRYLNLEANPISGIIPPQLGNLTRLRFLDLWIHGEMTADNLEWLPQLSSLETLGLSLGDNPISGTIPPQLGNLTRLRFLYLSSNGKMPADNLEWLPQLSSLETLKLTSFNPISGNIPPQLGNLTRLRFLYLYSDGEMTADNLEWLPQLTSLETLKLEGLKLSKPTDWLQSIQVAPSLSSLKFRCCQFPYKVPAASSLYHPNSSDSLTSLDICNTTIHPVVVPRLLNVSRNLINLAIVDTDNMRSPKIRGPLPNSFDNMKSLEYIDLSSNELEGGIPNSLGNLCNLKSLDLSNNHLNGTLVDLLESLTGCTTKSLEILHLKGNKLGDSFPDFSQFSSLRELRLANNNITGVVTEAHLQNLSKLKLLDLSSNSLTLNFASNWVPPFQLVGAKLSSCKLGAKFPGWLGTQWELFGLDISNSGISDTIPDWFYNLTPKLRYLNLSNNSIKGTLPEFPLTFDNYPIIDMSFNQFRGPIPTYLSNASALYLSNNKITNNLEQFLCTPMSQRPTVLLDISNNLLSGSLPDCWVPWKELKILNLENNSFYGTIPASLGSLYQIEILSLRNNNISGNLAPSLKNCCQLMVLDIGENNFNGKIPTWIGEYLTNLIVLCMKSNKFYGRLPSSICHLGSIQVLDLSLNHISGAIPWCFSNFTPLAQSFYDNEKYSYYPKVRISGTIRIMYISDPSKTYLMSYDSYAYITMKGLDYKYDKNLGLLRVIDLSSNKLSGEIPREVTNLVELGQLNLSRSNLSGIIPDNIGKMTKLESLDLSHNQLSGKIPMSLANISGLAFLDLSDNKLWGKIPTGTQLQTFDCSRYSGNNGLYGPPLDSCDIGGETTSNADDDDDDDDNGGCLDMSWFRMGVGVGFAIGFSGAFGLTLFFFNSWISRYAYRILNHWGFGTYGRPRLKRF